MTPRGSSNVPAWLPLVRQRLAHWRRAGLGSRWLVAVSGGSDSVGLLRLLHGLSAELNLELSVAHLNHGVRGEEAAADARFVADLAAQLGLAVDIGTWQPDRASHFEAEARLARYRWLSELARARGASAVAVGHTSDDQAETILHRIVRGTGLRGLRGMPARRALTPSVQLVRPLLRVSRLGVQAFLEELGQPYREDASNDDLTRTRARIRHDLLPRLAAEYNPRVAEALVRLGHLAADLQRSVDDRLEGLIESATVSSGPESLVLLCGVLQRLPVAHRAELIRTAWRTAGWPEGRMTARDWLRLASVVRRERGRFTIKGGVHVWLSADILRLSRPGVQGDSGEPARVGFPVPGSVIWGRGRIEARFGTLASADEAIDFDSLRPFLTTAGQPHLWVKAAAAADRFDPLGMEGKTVRLNDFLRGRHVAAAERDQVPVLYDRDGIVWVVGHRIAHRVRVTAETTRTLSLRWTCD